MKILHRDVANLTKGEKEFFELSQKKTDITQLENNVKSLSEEVVDKMREKTSLEEDVSTLEEKRTKIQKEISLFDVEEAEKQFIKISSENERHLVIMEKNIQEVADTQKSLNDVMAKRDVILEELSVFEKTKSVLEKEVADLGEVLSGIRLEKEQLSTVLKKSSDEIKKAISLKQQAFDTLVQEMEAETKATIASIKEEEGKVAEALLDKRELSETKLIEMEERHMFLVQESKELSESNLVEKEKAGKLLADVEKRELEVIKMERQIVDIKENALNEIYHAAKKHKVDKINEEVRKLL